MRAWKGLVVAGLAAVALGIPSSAGAISPRDECENQGGVFFKVGGTQTCLISTTPGNNQGGVTKEESESQKGSSRSSHPEETERCVNNRGGRHCRD